MAGELAHVRTVLFDFDDTLVESLPGREAALRRAFAEAGVVSPTAEDFVRDVNGLTFTVPFAEIEQAHGRELNLLDRYRAAYWLYEAENALPYPGVVAMLEALRGAGHAVGVVTSKGRDFQVAGRRAGALYQMERGGLGGLFHVVVGGEDVTEHKPHPEAVLAALARLGVAPAEALMVGDTTSDFGAGRAAGCWVCHAAWGGGPTGPSLAAADPHYVASQPADVLHLLGIEAPRA